MRIYTVTCNGRPAAVVRADNPSDAVGIARDLGEPMGVRGNFAAREPSDGEMVSWLAHRSDHILADFAPLAAAS